MDGVLVCSIETGTQGLKPAQLAAALPLVNTKQGSKELLPTRWPSAREASSVYLKHTSHT